MPRRLTADEISELYRCAEADKYSMLESWIADVPDEGSELIPFVERLLNAEREACMRRIAVPTRAETGQCQYPECVERGPEGKCVEWLVGDCPGPTTASA